MMKKTFFILLLLFLALSCSKDLVVVKSKMYSLALQEDPQATLIVPKNMTDGIKCSDYEQGCLGAFQAKIKTVEMIFIEFETIDQAKAQAEKINQWYAWNWVFDDVDGEPVLEHFVQKVYQAKKGRSVERKGQ